MKLNLSLALAALLGWGAAAWLFSRPAEVKEQIVYKDRVQFVDKIVTRDVGTHTVKTETYPNGTKVVTETRTVDRAVEKVKTKDVERVKMKASSPRYSLGLSAVVPVDRPIKPEAYQLQLGRRIMETPLWLTAGIQISPNLQWRETKLLLGVSVVW